MKNDEIVQIAMKQSAEDLGCSIGDFLLDKNVVVPFNLGIKAKKFYQDPIGCNLTTYGNNVVAASTENIFKIIDEYVKKYKYYHCYETPNMRWLNEQLATEGQTVWLMTEYFVPDLNKLKKCKCQYNLRILVKDDFEKLYLPEWSNALCSDRRELNNIGIGAYDGDKLIGLAASTMDAENMWQIGVDVVPEYRRKGVASALTSELTLEILSYNKVPFYCSSWSNIGSVKNAIKCGFVPAWDEIIVKPIPIVDQLYNQRCIEE